MATLKHYLVNLSSQSIGRILNTIGNFVVFFLVARIMGAELFGQYSYILVFLGLAIMVSEFGTNSVLAKQIVEFHDTDQLYWGNFLIFRLISSVITLALGIAAAYFFRNDLFASLMLGCLAMFFLASRFFEPIFQIYDKPWYSLYANLAYTIIYTSSSLFVLYYFRSIYLLVLVYVIANIIYTTIAFSMSSGLIKPIFRYSKKHMDKLLYLAIPAGLSAILVLVHTRADVFMLAYMKSDYEVGIYNVAYKFLDMATILSVMLSTPILPIFSKFALEDITTLRHRFENATEIIAIATTPVAIIAPILSTSIISLFFGAEFIDSAKVLNIMAWIGVLTFFSVFVSIVLMAIEKIHFTIWLGGVAAALNVFLNYLLIPEYSYMGSAWATLAVEIVLLSVSLYYAVSVIGRAFRWKIWTRIIASNLVLFACVLLLWGNNIFLTLAPSIFMYILCLYLFKLPPFQKQWYFEGQSPA